MARRVHRDATFAGQARQRRPRQPDRRSGHRTGGVPRRLHPRRRSRPCCAGRRGWTTSPTRAEAAAATSVLATLTASPADALDVLQDPVALAQLSSWPFLDQGVVAGIRVQRPVRRRRPPIRHDCTTATACSPASPGWPTAPSTTASRRAWRRASRNSMIGYVDTLGRGIGLEDGGDVRVDHDRRAPVHHRTGHVRGGAQPLRGGGPRRRGAGGARRRARCLHEHGDRRGRARPRRAQRRGGCGPVRRPARRRRHRRAGRDDRRGDRRCGTTGSARRRDRLRHRPRSHRRSVPGPWSVSPSPGSSRRAPTA